MRPEFPDIVEKRRVQRDGWATQRGDRFGAFLLKAPNGSHLNIIACDGETAVDDQIWGDGPAFEHVSVTVFQQQRCPTWEEMAWVKDLFWDKEECVIQFHPPASHYVNAHPYCLHLWKPVNFELPIPPRKTLV